MCSEKEREAEGAEKGESREEKYPVQVSVVSPPHFSLPENSATPVVMFAGGTGGSNIRFNIFSSDLVTEI